MPTKSIYNIPEHQGTPPTQWVKNDIVYVATKETGLDVPTEIKYYYARKTVPNGTAITDSTFWGGFTKINNGNDNGKKMDVPQFIWTPSYNLSAGFQPKVNTINYGNGYSQRFSDGLYNNLIRLDVSFDMRNDSEARAIIHFLKTRKGTESFCLSSECIPDIYADSTNYNKRFICLSFTSNFNFSENHSIKASFQEINN